MSTEQHNPGNPEAWQMTYPATMEHAGDNSPLDEICDWLRANGLDPATLPADPHASMTNGYLTLHRKVARPGTNGGLVDVLNSDRTAVLTETITVRATVPPPPIVEIWLAPKCPTCGR